VDGGVELGIIKDYFKMDLQGKIRKVSVVGSYMILHEFMKPMNALKLMA